MSYAVITGPTSTIFLAPVGHGVVVFTQALGSATPAAASKTHFGNRAGAASSHAAFAAIAQFPSMTADRAMMLLAKMQTDVSRRIGYRVKLGELEAAA